MRRSDHYWRSPLPFPGLRSSAVTNSVLFYCTADFHILSPRFDRCLPGGENYKDVLQSKTHNQDYLILRRLRRHPLNAPLRGMPALRCLRQKQQSQDYRNFQNSGGTAQARTEFCWSDGGRCPKGWEDAEPCCAIYVGRRLQVKIWHFDASDTTFLFSLYIRIKTILKFSIKIFLKMYFKCQMCQKQSF